MTLALDLLIIIGVCAAFMLGFIVGAASTLGLFRSVFEAIRSQGK